MAKQTLSAPLKNALAAGGCADPAHEDLVHEAMAAGVPQGKLIDWLTKNGPLALEIIKALLDTFGKRPATP